ncbi:MAG TPA: hypothetical protein VLV28_08575, partial [Gaiellaceae bacterium]|nr:hypothetical protein [Gaiellaceae bacterium]
MSKAKIVVTFDPDAPTGFVEVRQGYGGASRGKAAAGVLRPFHEANGAIEVRLEIAPLLGADPVE